ncbi:hypothetical protein [Raineyella fluvialis]|uniref:Signal transduction histidine kinase n=1 Tax=Raineyella fluvialis TaxID=2662261 RepID=A0A5Q2FCE1_9ACTN|nr:hypothetical protein [Raineyella fluvialis]QGF23417.1 hypothetical protein Rai3103_06770 [Raineyella fluvialis]
MTRSIPTAFLIVLAAVFAGLQVVLGLGSLQDSLAPEASVIAMVVYAVLMALMLRPGAARLPAATSWSAVAGTGLITVLVQYGLPTNTWPGYAAWHPSALQCLLVVLALRGRPRLAALGCTLFAAMTIAWSLTTQPGVGEGVRIALAPVLFVATAIALARFLDTNDRQAEAKTRQALALLDEAARARAHTVEAADWVAGIRDLAMPSLALAADPDGPLPEHLRHRMLETEAAIRDRVRGGSLATDEVLLRISVARSRGITVHLLDDRGAVMASHELGALVDALDQLLPSLDGQGTLTVRARPEGTIPAITIVFAPSGAGESVYIEL